MARCIRHIASVILLVVALGGVFVSTSDAAAPSPLLRLVHASSNAPAIDVYANGQKVTTAPQFADVAPYVSLPAGAYHLRVLAAGAGAAGPAFLDTDVDLREGEAYTILAADRVGQMIPVFLDDTLGIPADGKAHVRLVHASPDAPALADVAVAGGPVVARNLPFKGATPYLTIDPGVYAFEIRPAGTTQALATTPAITFDADRTYSVFVMGQFGDNTFRAVLARDNADSGGVAGGPSTGGGGMATPGPGRAAWALALLPLLILVLALARRLRARAAR